MNPLSLPSYKIDVPPFWTADWQGELESAGDTESLIIHRLMLASSLLRDWEDRAASPSQLAWMCLWTRAFSCLQGARGALRIKSSLTMNLLERAAFEMVLISQVIVFPSTQLDALSQPGNSVVKVKPSAKILAWAECKKRLEAYCAWCLASDLDLLSHKLQKPHVAALFDSASTEAIASDPEVKDLHEMLFGPLHEPSSEELARDRAKYERNVRDDQVMVRHWLEHPVLAEWNAIIRERKTPQSASPGFFSLFDPTERSVNDRLKNHDCDMGFAYSQYKRASQLMHGSTILNHITLASEKSICPNPNDIEGSIESLAGSVNACCTDVLTHLHLLKPYLD